VKPLTELGGSLDGDKALEIGCGTGYGTQFVVGRMGASSIDAVDPDPTMVERTPTVAPTREHDPDRRR